MHARQAMRSGRGDALRRIQLALAPARLLLIVAPGTFAPPPAHERAREMTAILNSSDLNQVPGVNRPVNAIERAAPDLYRVRAGGCALKARIVNRPRESSAPLRVGPREFTAEFGPLVCGPDR